MESMNTKLRICPMQSMITVNQADSIIMLSDLSERCKTCTLCNVFALVIRIIAKIIKDISEERKFTNPNEKQVAVVFQLMIILVKYQNM